MRNDFMTRVSTILDDDAPIQNFNLTVYCNKENVDNIRNEFNFIPTTIIPELWRHSWVVRHVLNIFRRK